MLNCATVVSPEEPENRRIFSLTPNSFMFTEEHDYIISFCPNESSSFHPLHSPLRSPPYRTRSQELRNITQIVEGQPSSGCTASLVDRVRSALGATLPLCQALWLSMVCSRAFSVPQQCCDLGYHASLNRALRTFLSAELNLEQSKHEGLDAIENAVENLDATSDKQRLMEMYNNVFCPPMKFEFQPHMGDMVRPSSHPHIPKGLELTCV